MQDSKIQWTHHTLNPWRGCQRVSPGCLHCYAETLSHRNPSVLGVWGPLGTRVVAAESQWREPIKWNRAAQTSGERHRVFCASLADVFEDWTGIMVDSEENPVNARGWWSGMGYEPDPDEILTMDHVRARLASLILGTPHLDWLLLTKRPQNVIGMAEEMFGMGIAEGTLFPPNVWIGTTVEDQIRANERVPILLTIPATVRFLSAEPLLGPLDLTAIRTGPNRDAWNCLNGQIVSGLTGLPTDEDCGTVQWVIVGGESGSQEEARPFQLD